jgi:hypothetical protein
MVKRTPKAWKRAYYTITARVDGMCFGETGLGYHCDWDICVEGLSGGKEWVVDHVASGRRIWAFPAEARAQYFIEQIAHYTNWNAPIEEIMQLDRDILSWVRVRDAAHAAETWRLDQATKLLKMRRQARLEDGVPS